MVAMWYSVDVACDTDCDVIADGSVDEWEADWSWAHQAWWSVHTDGENYRCLPGGRGGVSIMFIFNLNYQTLF